MVIDKLKTANTPDNQKRFSSLYWGQRVLVRNPKSDEHNEKILYADYNSSGFETTSKLHLKNIDNISDEDAIKVAKMNNYHNGENDEAFIKVGKDILERVLKGEKYPVFYKICLPYDCADYLRSKGYALPYLDLSIQDLIDYGWIIIE